MPQVATLASKGFQGIMKACWGIKGGYLFQGYRLTMWAEGGQVVEETMEGTSKDLGGIHPGGLVLFVTSRVWEKVWVSKWWQWIAAGDACFLLCS